MSLGMAQAGTGAAAKKTTKASQEARDSVATECDACWPPLRLERHSTTVKRVHPARQFGSLPDPIRLVEPIRSKPASPDFGLCSIAFLYTCSTSSEKDKLSAAKFLTYARQYGRCIQRRSGGERRRKQRVWGAICSQRRFGSARLSLHRTHRPRIPAIFTFRFLTGEPPSSSWAIRPDGATSDLARRPGGRDGKDACGAGGAGRRFA